MHYIEAKSILSKNNGMNLYRGCSHGCIYCDSRSAVYNMNHKFEDIEVKRNSLELLKKELKRRPKAMIGTGSMTDPYIPLEAELGYVRNALKLIYRYGFGFTCITKSDLVLRDLELIKKINEKTKAVVQITLTSACDEESFLIEPEVCPTSRRVEVLKILKDNNIPTVVWMTPILPYINDTYENINRILDFCIESDVQGVVCFGMGLTLRDANRQYFYKKLDELYPNLKEKYITQYGNSYEIISPKNKELMDLFYKKTSSHGILNKPSLIFDYLSEFPKNESSIQTSLF